MPGSTPPTSQLELAHLDDGNDRAILVQGLEGPAQIVRLGHRGTPSIDVSDEIAILAARPIASLRWRGTDSNFRFRDALSHTSGRRIGTQVGGFWTRRQNRFATDSPLEGNGFELSVRGHGKSRCRLFVPLDCLGRVGAPERGDGDCRQRSRILARRNLRVQQDARIAPGCCRAEQVQAHRPCWGWDVGALSFGHFP